jgi:hypothetical protein
VRTPGVRAASALLVAAVAVPAGGPLGGLPADDAVQLAALGVAAAPLVSASVRAHCRALLERLGLPVVLLLAALGLVLLARLVLALVAAPVGFEACYSVRVGSGPERRCAPLYGDLLRDDGVSRHDEVIRFGSRSDPATPSSGLASSNWNISAVNSLRYNFFRPGQLERDRLPISVRWTAEEVPATSRLRVTWVGEGEVRVGSRTAVLAPSYASPGSVVLEHVGGSFSLRLDFTRPRTAPLYAAATVTDDDGGPVRPVDPLRPLRALLTLALLPALVGAGLAVLRAAGPWAPLAAVGLPLLWLASLGAVVPAAPVHASAYLAAALVVLLAWTRLRRGPAGLGVVAVLAAVTYALGQLRAGNASLDVTTYRTGGDDFLTYESFARDILESGTLRGGEDVFVYSPGFRYLVYAQHRLFGDGDLLQGVLHVSALVAGCYWAWTRLGPARLPAADGGRRVAAVRRLAVGVAVPLAALFALTGLALTGSVSGGGFALLSEYPTWLALLFGFPLALTTRRRRDLLVLSLLLGVAMTIRMEHAPGLAVVWVLGAWRLLRRPGALLARLGRAAVPAAVLAAVVSLPLLHNVAYGGEAALLPRTPDLPVNFPLPPRELPSVLASRDAEGVLRSQVAGVLVLPELRAEAAVRDDFRRAVRVVQVAWLVAVGWALLSRRRWRLLLPLAVPVVLLAPHLFIQVYVYYPRHVVIGYLAAAVAVLHVVCSVARERAQTEEPAGSTAAAPPSSGAGPASSLDPR